MNEIPWDILFGGTVFLSWFVLTRMLAAEQLDRLRAQREQFDEEYSRLLRRREELAEEKHHFEEEAADIFILYELTKQITRNFDEQQAVRIFKHQVLENTGGEECLFLTEPGEQVATLQADPDYEVVEIKAHNKWLGVLAVRGGNPAAQEKVAILAQQFGLALQRIRLYQDVERLAITDSLTGIHTRRYILERFGEELNRARTRQIPISFLMIDVDYFKHFNDQYGHLTGDQILRRIVEILAENIREIDILGRYGGEEFCVILPDTERDGAHYVAERMRAAVERTPILAYDAKVNVTVSIGIATFPADGKKTSELIDKADWALYRAKKQGRNLVCAFGVYE